MKHQLTGANKMMTDRSWFCFTFFLCEAVFTLALLCDFPGILNVDSINQMMQAVGEIKMNNHHPIVHTAIIKLIISTATSCGIGINIAVGIYTFFQLTMLSLTFAVCAQHMCLKRISGNIIILAAIFYAFSPINIKYAITMWKDIPFSCFVLLYTIVMWQISSKTDKGEKLIRREIAATAFSGIGFCLFRTNGIIDFAILTVITSILFIRRSKEFVITNIAVLLCAVMITGPVYSLLGFNKQEPLEVLAVQIQQISAVLKYNGNISAQQKELIGHVADPDGIAFYYRPNIADSEKDFIALHGDQSYIIANKKQFFSLWVELGKKNPGLYLRAYWELIKGYIIPDRTGYIVDTNILSNSLGIKLSPKLPGNICAVVDAGINLPFIENFKTFFSIGIIDELILLAFIICVIRKKKGNLILFAPSLIILATLLVSSPSSGQFRYMYSSYISLPVLIYLPFSKNQTDMT